MLGVFFPQPNKTIGIPTQPWASLPKAPGSLNQFSSSSKNLKSDLLILPGHAGVNQQTVQRPGPVVHWLQIYKCSALGPRLLLKPHRRTCHCWVKVTCSPHHQLLLLSMATCSDRYLYLTGSGLPARILFYYNTIFVFHSHNIWALVSRSYCQWENKVLGLDWYPIQCSQDGSGSTKTLAEDEWMNSKAQDHALHYFIQHNN